MSYLDMMGSAGASLGVGKYVGWSSCIRNPTQSSVTMNCSRHRPGQASALLSREPRDQNSACYRAGGIPLLYLFLVPRPFATCSLGDPRSSRPSPECPAALQSHLTRSSLTFPSGVTRKISTRLTSSCDPSREYRISAYSRSLSHETLHKEAPKPQHLDLFRLR